MMKLKGSRAPKKPLSPRAKKLIIIIGSSVLGLLLVAYVVTSILTWRSLDQRSLEAGGALKQDIDNSLGSATPPSNVSGQLSGVISRYEKSFGQQPCETLWLYRWQTIIPPVRDLRESCLDRSTTTTAVIDSLKRLNTFLGHEQQAADLLAQTVASTAETTDYAGASTAWLTISETPSLPAADPFSPVQSQQAEVATSIGRAFAAVASAIAAEDRTALDAALAALSSSYQSISQIQQAAAQQRALLVTDLLANYQKLL